MRPAKAAPSLSGDGNTAIVGGAFDNMGIGAAWLFTRSGRVWSQQAKLVGTGAIGGGIVFQGASVALSGDGDTALVGGPCDGCPGLHSGPAIGAAWVFTRSGAVWSQQTKLVAADTIGGPNQGESVSLSGDGNTAVIGGPGDNNGAGAAWVFTRSRQLWSEQAKLVGTGFVAPSDQGQSVALSDDGKFAVVGGFYDDGFLGAAWVFARSGRVWSERQKLVGTAALGTSEQGSSVALSSDRSTAIVGGPFDNGAAGAAWVYAQPIFAGTPGRANCFGTSVAALAQQYHGLNAAAAALGYASVPALQNAILTYCDD